jgi:methyltransferase FkbM-like protein
MGARETIKRQAGALARATIIRPGRRWRVPLGIGHGLKVIVEAEVPLHRYVGTAERELSKYVRRHVKAGTVCFAVGGYDGYYALLLARRSGAEVWCFEADPKRIERIRANLTLNPIAASKINVVDTYVAHESKEDSRTDTLDRLVYEAGVSPPGFTIIDVEGAEATVLSGASRLLREHPPTLVVETHSERLSAECLALLHAAGYTAREVKRRRFLRENRGNGHNEWIVAYPPTS